MNEGWKCPGCGTIYGPMMSRCPECMPREKSRQGPVRPREEPLQKVRVEDEDPLIK